MILLGRNLQAIVKFKSNQIHILLFHLSFIHVDALLLLKASFTFHFQFFTQDLIVVSYHDHIQAR